VRFVDFLKATVLLSAGAATALAGVTVIALGSTSDGLLRAILFGWWVVAALLGTWAGRHTHVSAAIARLLASARPANAIPELRLGYILLNRLWPLLIVTLAAGALAFLAPQIPGIFAGGALLVSLYFRRQDAAVSAIEERDGVQFYVRQTSPMRPIALDRTIGFRALPSR
jgi:hypothetical protein